MNQATFTFKDHDGIDIFVYKWSPDSGKPKGCIQFAHGRGEHAGRYAAFAERCTRAGYVVYADDHRGHGKTAETESKRGNLGPGGWNSVIKDLKQLTDIIKKENPGLTVFFVGNSWGSGLGQSYIQCHGSEIKGIVLGAAMDTPPAFLINLAILITRLQIKRNGPDAPNSFLSSKKSNKNPSSSPTEDDYNWLSRDPEARKAFAEDPMRARNTPNGLILEFFLGYAAIRKVRNERKIPVDLAILFISGTNDPFNGCLKKLRPLVERYKTKYRIKDVSTKYYDGARHDLLNEVNTDEVARDILAWMDARL